jgi:hypothetical protein
VRVVLDGVDKYHNLFGSVMYPEADKPASLAEALVTAGLAKVRGVRAWRAARVADDAAALVFCGCCRTSPDRGAVRCAVVSCSALSASREAAVKL